MKFSLEDHHSISCCQGYDTKKRFHNESTEKGHNNSALLTHDNTICLPSGDTALDCFSGSSASHITYPRFSQLLLCSMAHTCKRDATGWVSISNSQNSVLSYGHYSFKLILDHFSSCALYSIHTKLLAHLQAPSSWTPHLFANAVPLSTWNVLPYLIGLSNKHINAFWVPAQSGTLLHPGGSPEAPTGVGGGGDLTLRLSVHWVLQS